MDLSAIDSGADLMRLRGCRIVFASGREWYGRAGGHFAPLSASIDPEPDPAEVARMLSDEAAVAARFRTKSESGVALGRYYLHSIPSLAADVESRIAAGLDRMYYRPVTSSELLLQGYQLNLDTLRRQRRSERELSEARRWWQYAAAVDVVPEAEAHGVYEGGEMAAYLILLRSGSHVEVLQQASRDRLAHLFPDDTLTASVVRMVLGDNPNAAIAYGGGVHGVVPGDAAFFESHGFDSETWRWRIVLNPRIQAVLGAAPLALGIRALANVFPQSRRLEYIDAALKMRASR